MDFDPIPCTFSIPTISSPYPTDPTLCPFSPLKSKTNKQNPQNIRDHVYVAQLYLGMGVGGNFLFFPASQLD